MSFTYFEADDRCMGCGKLILTEHENFLFWNGPDAIRLHPGEANAEWRPGEPDRPIPFDNGPARVAYVWESHENNPHLVGEPVVLVHEWDKLYVPCRAAHLDHIGAWLWICQPATVANPADEDWMRSISS